MWDKLAECTASTSDQFSHGNQRSLGKILLSPLPPCNVVRKERLADESSNIASGGKRGASDYCSNSGKRHLSHTFWPGLSISRTFTTNAHNSKCMECTVSKFVWVKFVHVLHTILTSRLWKNSFVAIYQRFRGQQTSATRAYFECVRRVSYYAASCCGDSSRSRCSPSNSRINRVFEDLLRKRT